MKEIVMTYLERACFFMIVAELILQFSAGAKYEKYISMLTGIICTTILVIPVGNLFFQGGIDNYFNKMTEFETIMSEFMKNSDMDSEYDDFEKLQEDMETKLMNDATKEYDKQQNNEQQNNEQQNNEQQNNEQRNNEQQNNEQQNNKQDEAYSESETVEKITVEKVKIE